MERNFTKSSLGALLILGGMSLSAYAATYTFTFGSGGVNGLSANDTASQIATSMTNLLVANGCTGCSVEVQGAVVDTTYTGDSQVVGANGVSSTLGNSPGATSNSSNATPSSSYTDNFLATTNDASTQISTEISLAFTGLTITGVSFGFEIFPNGSCPSLSSCGSSNYKGTGFDEYQPDFEFTAGTGAIGSGTAVDAFGSLGTGFVYGVAPASTSVGSEKAGSNGSSTKSPDENPELAPQWIGVSGALALSNVTDLNFVDWPATIGIDNLEITYTTTGSGGSGTVPEPSSILLFATVAGALVFRIRRIVAAR